MNEEKIFNGFVLPIILCKQKETRDRWSEGQSVSAGKSRKEMEIAALSLPKSIFLVLL